MGHYDRPTHTCDAEEHDWTERVKNQSVEVTLVSGVPCLKLHWQTEYHCTQEGSKHRRGSTDNYMAKCQETKRGDSNTSIVPIESLEEDLDRYL